jgi:hypothetical protein
VASCREHDSGYTLYIKGDEFLDLLSDSESFSSMEFVISFTEVFMPTYCDMTPESRNSEARLDVHC